MPPLKLNEKLHEQPHRHQCLPVALRHLRTTRTTSQKLRLTSLRLPKRLKPKRKPTKFSLPALVS